MKTPSSFLVKMKEKDPQSEVVRGICMLFLFGLAAAAIWALDWSKQDGFKKIAKIVAKHEENRLNGIRNDISRLRGKLHLKLQDYREANNER